VAAGKAKVEAAMMHLIDYQKRVGKARWCDEFRDAFGEMLK